MLTPALVLVMLAVLGFGLGLIAAWVEHRHAAARRQPVRVRRLH